MSDRLHSRPKRFAFRLLALVVVGAVTLVVVELALHAMALFVGPRASAAGGEGAEEVVLCLGDSNTYGVFYSEEQTYPAQLQAVLDRRAPGRYRVVNLGLPGMNSSQMAKRLPRWLERYRPRAVVVTAGINNYWNRAATAGHSGGSGSIVDRLRLPRLIRQLLAEASEVPENSGRPVLERVPLDDGRTGVEHRAADTGRLVVRHEGDIGAWNLSHSAVARELCADLETMAELTSKYDVELWVMTYAAFPLPGREPRFSKQRNVNEAMRLCARRSHVGLIDPRARFLELLPPGVRRTTLFATETDSHPNPVGYREIATLVADAIRPGTTVVDSLLDRLREARIERQEVPFEQVTRRRIRIAKDERPALFQHPTSSVSFADIEIVEGMQLAFAIGVHPDVWDRAGDGVRFSIEIVDADGERSERYARYVDPKHQPQARRWIDERIDLTDLGGRRVTIVFRTLPGPADNPHFDWSAWAEPRLVFEKSEDGGLDG